MSKWMKLTVVLALALVLFLVGKEKGWFKMKPAGNNAGDDPTEPTGTTGTGTTGNTGTGGTGTGNTGTGGTRTGGTGTGNTGTGNTGTLPASFDPKYQARNLQALLADWWDNQSQDEQAFKIILSYTDAQIKAVDKAWREIFLTVNGNPTLYRAVDTEVVLGRATIRDMKLKCLDKMKKLKLDEK